MEEGQMSDTERILKYLSSSEINRCRINGADLLASKTNSEWQEIFNQSWVNKKLRKRLYTLYNLEILPIKRPPLIGVSGNELWYKDMVKNIQQQYLDAEDRAILGGNNE